MLRACLFCLSAVACTPFEGSRLLDDYQAPAPTEVAFPGARVEGEGVHTIQLDDGSTMDIPYVVQEGVAVAEGDIVLGAADSLVQRAAAVAWSNSRWPCTIPYRLSDQLHAASEQDFLSAVAHWEANTGLRFVEDPTADDVIVVYSGSGCSSALGRTGGVQHISLAPLCGRGAAIHEIGHAIGLFHEQARTDRDEHVAVHWHNVPSYYRSNFETYVASGLPGSDLGDYDLGSIMHYGSDAFSSGVCYPGETQGCTLTHLDGTYITENQRHTLSPTDIAAVAEMYPDCEGGTPPLVVDEDDHANTFTGATVVSESTAIDGHLQFDDHDVFALDFPVGTELALWTTGTTDTVGVLYESYAVVQEDDTTGEGPNFAMWTVATDAPTHLDVQGWTVHTTGPYTLHVLATPPEAPGPVEPEPPAVTDDHGDTLANATLIELVGPGTTSLTAEITPSDVDVFRIDVATAGTVWVLTSDGTDLSGTLLDASGTALHSDDPPGDSGVVLGISVQPGTFYARLDGHGAADGLYAVSFTLQ
jgi:hypothetical protein